WNGTYRLSGVVKLLTASVSVATAIAMARLIPKALSLPSQKDLTEVNEALQRQIEERDYARQILRAQSEKLTEQMRLVDLAYDAIVVCDLDEVIQFWNCGAENMYGWSRAEVQGRKLSELLDSEFPRPPEEIRAAVLAQGHWEGQIVHKSRLGSRLIVS